MLKRFAVLLLSALLTIQPMLSPVCVYAEGATTSDINVGTADASLDDSQIDASVGEGASASNEVVIDSQSNPGSNDAEMPTEDESAIAQAKPTQVSLDVVDFVYVENSLVSLGEQWNLAIALKDAGVTIDDACATLVDSEGTSHVILASDCAGNAVRFAGSFDEQSQALRYTLRDMTYTLSGGETFYVSFEDDEVSQNTYSFEVVSSDVKDSLTDPDGDDVSAVVINEDGSLESADSVEEALSLADSSSDVAVCDVDDAGDAGRAAARDYRENYLVVAIDPGHGGNDPGACANGVVERDVNWSIANHFKDELSTYTGVTPYLTTNGEEPGLEKRVQRAASVGADVFISVHVNSAASNAGGCEVWVPNNSSYNNHVHKEGEELGTKIVRQLASLGLTYRGVKSRDWGQDSSGANKYPDGSMKDYYSVIRTARTYNIPGIIVEHAFVTNKEDAARLADDSFRYKLGVSDARGVAEQYNLVKDKAARANATVGVTAYVSNLGWESTVYDKKVAGTTGKSLGLQSFKVSALNSVAQYGGVAYRANVDGAWQDWKTDGQEACAAGKGKSLQAVQLKLTGAAANKYDIWYSVHSANFGWLGWTKNGSSAGSVGYGRSAQALEVVIVPKGSSAPGATANSFFDHGNDPVELAAQAHVSRIGWMAQQKAAEGKSVVIGTTGHSLPLEAVKFSFGNKGVGGGIQARAHVKDIGWQNWVDTGAVSGTTGKSRRMEAICLRLTGDLASKYDIYYRAHVANIGWLGWAKNGEKAGSQGYSYAAEAIEVRLVKKGSAAPSTSGEAFKTPLVIYNAHVQNIGWQNKVRDGVTAGTTGRGLRMEALNVSLGSWATSSSVQVRAHVANIGWQNWTTGTAGTTGRGLAIEALQIKLTGEAAQTYDVYYRVHSANFGWLGWAKNGESAGSQGFGRAAQAVQIKLVRKGGTAPGSTATPFRIKESATSTDKIMGKSTATAAQMAAAYKRTGRYYPSNVYASKGASTIDAFAQIVVNEAEAEGVRADVVFAQAMLETGWLSFGGSVKASQCNFAGIGAVNAQAGGATFKNVAEGIRAQVQHLKAYACTDKLNKPCVDPRFHLVKRGCAPLITDLNGKWAVPGTTYGQNIMGIIARF